MSRPLKLASFALNSCIKVALHARPTSRLSALRHTTDTFYRLRKPWRFALTTHASLAMYILQPAQAPESVQVLAFNSATLHPWQ